MKMHVIVWIGIGRRR